MSKFLASLEMRVVFFRQAQPRISCASSEIDRDVLLSDFFPNERCRSEPVSSGKKSAFSHHIDKADLLTQQRANGFNAIAIHIKITNTKA